MKDFTKKGTKLPVIPVGTKFRTTFDKKSNRIINEFHSSTQREKLISHGQVKINNKIYIRCDEESYEGDNNFLIKLSTIERLAKEQGMYNTNNETMNPKVKLQENGTVTVTDTETTTTLSKVTVDEICRLVKEQPKLRKINVWYGSKEYPKLCWRSDESNCYGLNWKGNWEFKSRNSKELSTLTDDDYELSPETVEQYLREEAVKRGFVKGTKYKHIKFDTVEVLKKPENLKLILHNDCNNLTDGCGGSIFDKSVWATIIKPETITRAEAEKQLGKVITD